MAIDHRLERKITRLGKCAILKVLNDGVASWLYEGYVKEGKKHWYGREICHTGKYYEG